MGGKSRKTGGISLSLIKRIKDGGQHLDNGETAKKKCGSKKPGDGWNPFGLGEKVEGGK